MNFSTDAIADFEGLLGSSARKTLRRSVFSKNGLASPGGKSRNLQAANVGKGTARCAAVLCGISLRIIVAVCPPKIYMPFGIDYFCMSIIMVVEGDEATMKMTPFKLIVAILLLAGMAAFSPGQTRRRTPCTSAIAAYGTARISF